MAHTKEPWKVDPNYPRDIQAGGYEVSTAFADYQQGEDIRLGGKIAATEAEARANARRIVACVNALAGYNPDAVADVVEAAAAVVRGAYLQQAGASDGGACTWAGPTPAAIADLDAALARLRGIDNA